MLESYAEFRSSDLDQIQAAVVIHAQGDRAEVMARRPRDAFIANAARFGDAALIFGCYDTPITLGFKPADYVRLVYQIREVSEVTIEGKPVEKASRRPGYLIPSDARWQVRHPTGFRNLSFRVGSETLQRKLTALLDSDRVPLDLRQPSMVDPRHARLLRESVFHLAGELEAADPQFAPRLAASAIEAISLRLLTGLSGTLLDDTRPPAAPSAIQMGRVETYLVEHFTEPLTIERMVEISGVSARAVFRHFLSRYGCTPQGYLARIRLDMARIMLPTCHDRAAVTAVALTCGFHSVSQFEHAYRNRFGELPLQTFRCVDR